MIPMDMNQQHRKEGERMAVIQQFRTAVGGFNRQDVQDYIERLAAAHRQELAELQKRLEEADARSAQLEQDLAAARRELEGAGEEAKGLRTSLEESEKTSARLRGELSQADAKLTVARRERERFQARIAELEPLAQGYRQLKDRAASVELDAHQRAQTAVNEARAEGERIRGETRKWLGAVMEEYAQLRRRMDEALAQVLALSTLPDRIEPMDETAQRLREQGGLK